MRERRQPSAPGSRLRIRTLAVLTIVVAAASAAATPTPKPAPRRTQTPGALRAGAPGGPTDFSGIWVIDAEQSQGGASNMEGAILEVSQKGDHIWIQPLGRSRTSLLAEEVVVDGRTYEKGIGEKDGRRGSLTAQWGSDARSLWLEVAAGPEDNPRAAIQRSVWRLSDDRSTWVRETNTLTMGAARRSRLVFRRVDPRQLTPTPDTGKR